MKKRTGFKLALIALITILATSSFTGCYIPSPLYGSWTDNLGNRISFMNDGSFVAQINNTSGEKVTYSGTYSVVDNVLIFNIPGVGSRIGEWDVRGSIFSFTWVHTDGNEVKLQLYHTSR